ncbi:hypothetical protein [Leptolyngbya sp. FACHB-17]|uniref:serine/threonine protein kinase n=1 Tax=unclassified Leptolyngbya TaxID=2650499 RepID=UPI00168023B4|nr:hypothetical protein [Leptolyngbya sp. FACHB-17]MBD2081925.1 hypothetical protein [Leptolyngbya sp. FACHB-17]
MQTPLSVDTILGDRYCVLKILHQSAAGWVYLAIDQTTKGVCVLEEISAIDPSALPFLQEQYAELLPALKLRQVAHYQTTIVDFDRFYLVRDYTEGHSYRELFEQKRIFSAKEVTQFFKQILAILRSLQRREIAHQNLSLNSIIQRLDGSLMLAEFTQASFVEREFNTDLYLLAVLSIVLLTGCEPKELYDETTQSWKWRDRADVQSRLAQVLDRMLSPNPQSRYSSAAKVTQALSASHQPDFAAIVFTFALLGLAAISAYRLINYLPNLQTSPPIALDTTASPTATSKETVQQRSKRLGLRDNLLQQIVDDSNGVQTPEKLLEHLETLSQEARSDIGTYKRVNYNAWLSSNKEISERAIELLTDAQFVSYFPEQEGKVLNPRTFGQIWYAIARDQITKNKFETLPARASGTLKNGIGKVYRSQFKQGQTLKLNLKSDSVSVWIITDNATPLKNFDQSTWTGKVTRSGIYEIVIVPNTAKTTQYELSIDSSSTSR